MSLRPALFALLLALACTPSWAQDDEDFGGDDLLQFLIDQGLLSTPQVAPPPPADGYRSEAVVAAMGALGVPYRWGGGSYDSGFDCSGFVQVVYRQTMNVQLPRVAAQQAAATRVIGRDELEPGDLVFFNTLGRRFSHVGIYVGDHKFIHSPKPGAAVRIEDMRVRYWDTRFDAARRVGNMPAQAENARPQTAARQPAAPRSQTLGRGYYPSGL